MSWQKALYQLAFLAVNAGPSLLTQGRLPFEMQVGISGDRRACGEEPCGGAIGNIIGGAIFVAALSWSVYVKGQAKRATT